MPLLMLSIQDRSRFIWVTLAFMCVTAAALVARTTADTLFLSQFGHEHLSYMYLGTAAVVSTVAFIYSSLIGRLSIVRLIGLSIGFLLTILLLLHLGLTSSWKGVYIASYFAGDLIVHVPIMLFWSFAVLLFDPRQAKRLFGFIGAGGTLGCILVGFVIKPIATAFGTPALILLIFGLLTSFLLIVLRVSHMESHRFLPPNKPHKPQSQFQQYTQHFKTPQIRYLIGLVFVANMALALIDYQFKAGARQLYSIHELAGFFGHFYALTSVVALFIQLFLVHKILNKGGIKLGLSLLPVGIFIGCIGTLITTQFSWILGTKAIIQVFLFTIDIAALQMLYMGIPIASRNQARAFADGITKPIAIATAGIGLIGLAQLIPLHLLAIGGVILSILWLLLVQTNSKAYVSALIDSLGSKQFDLTQETAQLQDSTVATYVRDTLQTSPDEDIIYLLSMASEIPQIDWTTEYRKLITKNSPEIKTLAIRHLKEYGTQTDSATLIPLLDHPNAQIRSEAIRALSTLGTPNTVATLTPYLHDSETVVQAATISGLVNAGDLDQLIDAGIVLRQLLKSDHISHRIAAAHALADIKGSVLHRAYIGLLQDPEPAVQRAALESCRSHPDPTLLPILVPLLSEPEIGITVADVLADFGKPALDHLIPYLTSQNLEHPFQGAHLIPNILVAMGDLSTLPLLQKAADTPNHLLRHNALLAYASLLKKSPTQKPYLTEVYVQIQQEMTLAKHRKNQIKNIEPTPETQLLRDALENIQLLHLKNAFALMDALLPSSNILTVRDTLLRGEKTQNNALEVLDNVLPKQFKQDVIDFFETGNQKPVQTAPVAFGQILSEEEDIWVICGVLIAVALQKHTIDESLLLSGLTHPHPVVRETTLYTLHEQDKLHILDNQQHPLLEDPDTRVRTLAQQYFKNQQHPF